MRVLIYGVCAERNNKVLQVLESVTSQGPKDFCGLVVEKFDGYLNKCPSELTKEKILHLMAKRGFPGCFDSWDYKHYFWENCPVALAGQHKGEERGKRIVMEAMCNPFLYIRYFDFDAPSS